MISKYSHVGRHSFLRLERGEETSSFLLYTLGLFGSGIGNSHYNRMKLKYSYFRTPSLFRGEGKPRNFNRVGEEDIILYLPYLSERTQKSHFLRKIRATVSEFSQ